MPLRKPAKPPVSSPSRIVSLKGGIKRFSLAFLVLVTLVIMIVGEVNGKLSEFIRMHTVERLMPLMDLMAWPLDSIVTVGDKIHALFLLKEENKRLQEENQKLKKYYDLSRHIQMENEDLRKLLQVVREPESVFITAKVVSDVSGPYIRSALINAGRLQGVEKGQIVINEQGIVGRIIETGEKSARILLLTDMNSKIPVITADSRERCIAAGDNSEIIKILCLSDESRISAGEQVFTSGDVEKFPSGLLVGTIYTANDKALYVKPSVNWNHLTYVQVVSY